MSVQIDLSGRVALVTGGTKGIGAGIAREFLRAGAEVYVCSRNEPDALPTIDGRTARFLPADVREPEQVEALLHAIGDRSGRLDTLVNNAGGAPPVRALDASIRFHRKVVELNLLAPLLMSQQAYPLLSASAGSVVMISSVAAHRPSPGVASYAAAKAGLSQLASTLATEFAPQVRVNTVTVGLTRTEAYEQEYGQQQAAPAIPMGRPAEPADIGQACVFLASPMAAYVNGSAITVDGGGETPEYLTEFTGVPVRDADARR